MQFLTEAIVLTILGGILGIVLGYIMATGLTKAMDLDIVPSMTVETIAVTAGISIAVGLIFGTYPAHKAAKLFYIQTWNNHKIYHQLNTKSSG